MKTRKMQSNKNRSESQLSQLGETVVEIDHHFKDDGHGKLDEQLRNVALNRMKNNKKTRGRGRRGKPRMRQNSMYATSKPSEEKSVTHKEVKDAIASVSHIGKSVSKERILQMDLVILNF